ncbi:unnamed protein product [Rotaria socialis]|uniref:VWFA domain-containing protein n=2 Tax=Rotaria socialis TaxID=392032 RepID=A0A817TLJ1_9BILA|nr:unnamed protein product [Rotaria socialis]CAF3623792.1 unnamed protein product [Rotaria socialis]CAF4323463.1 unnamed protein product [Rotaria socialis]CAF4674027.1 unnamed protein product [Rotaria socialis]
MNSRLYPQPSAPPPPPPSYQEVTNNIRQADPTSSYSTQNASVSQDSYMNNLNKFVNRYEISRAFAERLHVLRGYEIVFICDDSGSMTAPIGEANGQSGNQVTRWDELKRTVSIVVDLANVFDPDGVDVYFLNREPMLHVRDSSDLENLFVIAPEGATPVVPVLRQVLHEKRNQIYERKLLILIATDGIPTDERERPDIRTLEHVLKNERKPMDQIPVTIIICTDDYQSMNYLHDWDKTIPNLDVVHDYRSEKKQIQMCRGKDFPFNYGDYIVKILLGGVDSWFDDLNEMKKN